MGEPKNTKKKRSKWMKYSIGLVVLLVVVSGSIGFYMHYMVKGSNDAFVAEPKEGEVLDEMVGDSIDYSYWNKDKVITTMHKMTHQKVYATDKWGAVQMTEDRVEKLYEVVKNSSFSNNDILISILDKWKAGDFNSVDEDHNYFWQYQDGTVGKATGIMSEEDEQSFIESTFELYKKDAKE